MSNLTIWISFGTLIATVVGLSISLIKVWYDKKSMQDGIKLISRLIETN